MSEENMDNQNPGTQDNSDPAKTNDTIASSTSGTETKPSWQDSLSDDSRQHPSMQKFKSTDDLAKSYIELQKVLGKDKIILPTKDSTQTEINEFYKKLGRPDSPSDYKLGNVPDNVAVLMSPERVETFKGIAHKYGLTSKQFDGLVNDYLADMSLAVKGVYEAQDTQLKDAESKLMQEWGSKYDENKDLANRALKAFAEDEETKNAIKRLGKDPALIKVFAKVGKAMSEDQLIKGNESTLTLSKAEMQAEINRLVKGDKDHTGPYWNQNHEEHREVFKKIQDYYTRIAQMEVDDATRK